MNFKLETEFSKADILKEVDALKKQIDDLRPLPADVEGRVMQKLRLDWNYHSNAIEGNRLTYGETAGLLMEGITAKGKPLKDHLDIQGHNEAINFLLSIVKDIRPISEADIRNLHKMILVKPYDVKAQTEDGLPTIKHITIGEYKTSPNHVETATGETHYYATPGETPAKMQELMNWYAEISKESTIHPVVIAALFHHKFVAIHPFDDGNGRLSRILMNLILMQKGYPPVIIKMNDRQNYYALLSRADSGDNWPFIEYVIERLKGSLQLFLKAATGGDIEEDEDIDKEIELLRIQLKGDTTVEDKKTPPTMNRIFIENIFPLSERIINKLKPFESYFFLNENFIEFYHDEDFGIAHSSMPLDNNLRLAYQNEINKKLDEIHVVINLKEFKNIENKFDLRTVVKVIFDEFSYKIIVNEGILVSKLYHLNLSKIDINDIIKRIIEDFKSQLNKKQQSPKS